LAGGLFRHGAKDARRRWRRRAQCAESTMAVKIKSNDDRIKATAAAVLLICRARLGRGDFGGLISASLEDYRDDPDGFKEAFPKRDLAAAQDLAAMVEVIKDAKRREIYQQLLAAVDVVLARIERNKTQFNSLLELDNYFVASLKKFE
jgi:hypothetical protein